MHLSVENVGKGGRVDSTVVHVVEGNSLTAHPADVVQVRQVPADQALHGRRLYGQSAEEAKPVLAELRGVELVTGWKKISF